MTTTPITVWLAWPLGSQHSFDVITCINDVHNWPISCLEMLQLFSYQAGSFEHSKKKKNIGVPEFDFFPSELWPEGMCVERKKKNRSWANLETSTFIRYRNISWFLNQFLWGEIQTLSQNTPPNVPICIGLYTLWGSWPTSTLIRGKTNWGKHRWAWPHHAPQVVEEIH